MCERRHTSLVKKNATWPKNPMDSPACGWMPRSGSCGIGQASREADAVSFFHQRKQPPLRPLFEQFFAEVGGS